MPHNLVLLGVSPNPEIQWLCQNYRYFCSRADVQLVSSLTGTQGTFFLFLLFLTGNFYLEDRISVSCHLSINSAALGIVVSCLHGGWDLQLQHHSETGFGGSSSEGSRLYFHREGIGWNLTPAPLLSLLQPAGTQDKSSSGIILSQANV